MEQQPNMEASGIQTNTEVASGATDAIAPKADQVAYDTHRKLLGEKKALQAKHDELLASLAAQDEKAKAEQGEYKDLYSQSKTRVEELQSELQAAKEQQDNFRKLRAMLGAIEGKVDQAYYGHLGIENILLDPDTGDVDEMSLNKAVENFKKNHAVLIKKGTATPLPKEAAQYASGVQGINQLSGNDKANALGALMKKLPVRG